MVTKMAKPGTTMWIGTRKGLPRSNAFFTVKRQAMAADSCEPAGLYFGTTGGEVWGSSDEGETWKCLVRHLPEIYSLTIVENVR